MTWNIEVSDVLDSKDIERVKELLDRKPELLNQPDTYGEAMLHYVCEGCESDDLEIARFRLERGADVHARNRNLETPLHLAAQAACHEMIDLLFEYGAAEDIDSRTIVGTTALWKAALKSSWSPESANLILAHGATLDFESAVSLEVYDRALELLAKPDWRDRTLFPDQILFKSILCDDPRVLGAALEKGVDVNGKDAAEKTPLIFACHMARPDWMITMLLDHGADPTITFEGLTALEWMQKLGNERHAKLLSEYEQKE